MSFGQQLADARLDGLDCALCGAIATRMIRGRKDRFDVVALAKLLKLVRRELGAVVGKNGVGKPHDAENVLEFADHCCCVCCLEPLGLDPLGVLVHNYKKVSGGQRASKID